MCSRVEGFGVPGQFSKVAVFNCACLRTSIYTLCTTNTVLFQPLKDYCLGHKYRLFLGFGTSRLNKLHCHYDDALVVLVILSNSHPFKAWF